jgi:hypothetical protein
MELTNSGRNLRPPPYLCNRTASRGRSRCSPAAKIAAALAFGLFLSYAGLLSCLALFGVGSRFTRVLRRGAGVHVQGSVRRGLRAEMPPVTPTSRVR